MCDQCPDESDAVEEARWALQAAWRHLITSEQDRIRQAEREKMLKEDAEARVVAADRAMVWIGESRKVLVECSPWRLRAEGEDS